MIMTFNLALGLIASLTAIVIGLATMLLVLWQAPAQRDNQLMVLYMASVAAWGGTSFALHAAVLVGVQASGFLYADALLVAVNSLSTFAIAVRFARIDNRPSIRLVLLFGLICLGLVAPLTISGRIVLLESITPDGRFIYEYTALGLPFVLLLLGFHAGAFIVIWRHRRGMTRTLLIGDIVIIVTLLLGITPPLGSYSIDALGSAIASLLFARSILDAHLFAPMQRLNAALRASNARLTTLSEGLQATTKEL